MDDEELWLVAVEPSPGTSMYVPKQSTRGSATRKAPVKNEASGISWAKERPRNASTARNATFIQF